MLQELLTPHNNISFRDVVQLHPAGNNITVGGAIRSSEPST
jgi:hypothetical protein